MVDGLNFKDFVAFLSAFSTKAGTHQKVERTFLFYVLFHSFRFCSLLVFGWISCSQNPN